MQHAFQHLWKRWNKDYFSSLQYHQELHAEEQNLGGGDMVFIKTENHSFLRCKLARDLKIQIPELIKKFEYGY